MHEVAARARTGYLILLDQCPTCGGVWCDRWELFPLAAEEAERIDSVDAERLQAALPSASLPGRCPRCTTALQPFRDPMLPADTRIERCQVCDGMWLNRGQLAHMKRRTPRARPAADLAQLATRLGTAPTWATITNLDAATYVRDIDDSGAGALRDEIVRAGPWIVLQSLLRLAVGL